MDNNSQASDAFGDSGAPVAPEQQMAGASMDSGGAPVLGGAKKSKKGLIIGVIVGVLVIAGGAVAAIFLLGGSGKVDYAAAKAITKDMLAVKEKIDTLQENDVMGMIDLNSMMSFDVDESDLEETQSMRSQMTAAKSAVADLSKLMGDLGNTDAIKKDEDLKKQYDELNALGGKVIPGLTDMVDQSILMLDFVEAFADLAEEMGAMEEGDVSFADISDSMAEIFAILEGSSNEKIAEMGKDMKELFVWIFEIAEAQQNGAVVDESQAYEMMAKMMEFGEKWSEISAEDIFGVTEEDIEDYFNKLDALTKELETKAA